MVDDIEVVVTVKDVKHLRLVVSPNGLVRASVPRRVSKHEAEKFVREQRDWILAQKAKVDHQPAPATPMHSGDTLLLWGDALEVRLTTGRGGARPSKDSVTISVPSPSYVDTAILALYHREVWAVLDDIIAKWSEKLGRTPSRVSVRAMRTRWGSCTQATGAIRINPQLAARHPRCLDYVVLHEMVHLLERGHGPGFQALMDTHLPGWRTIRAELNDKTAGFVGEE